MSKSNRILNVIYDIPLSINQISNKLNIPVKTVHGRVSELKTRKLVKRINGKVVITDDGKLYIDNYNKKILSNNFVYKAEWNYIANNNIKIYANNKQLAYNLAKLIYGSKVEIKYIE